MLELEREAILHIAGVDPELPVARPGPAAEVGGHLVRLFDRLHGRHYGPELAEDAVFDYAATHARLNLALRSFFHPAAGRHLLWDLQNAAGVRPLLDAVRDERRRELVGRVLDGYEERVVPRWPQLRAHVVHGDFNLDNILLDERGRVSGIVDFGDIVHSAQVADFAVALASLLRGRPEGDVFRVARIAIDGYASRLPFEPAELDLLGNLVAARLATIVAISAWRSERYPENREYIEAWDADSWRLLEHFDEIGADEVSYRLGRGEARGRNGGTGPATAASPRAGARPPDIPDAGARRARRGRLALRGGRHAAARRVQQRARRRALPPTRDRGGRPADAAPEHPRALPLRAADRARRATRRLDAAGVGARHGHPRQLGQRGQRARLAARAREHGPARRDRQRARLPRSHDRDRRPLAGGVARGPPAGARRDRVASGRGRLRGCGRAPGRAGPGARGHLSRHRVHERRRPRPGTCRAAVSGRADASSGRAVRRGRGPGRARPARRAPVGLPAVRPGARRGHPRQADGQRLPGGGGDSSRRTG